MVERILATFEACYVEVDQQLSYCRVSHLVIDETKGLSSFLWI